MSDIGEMVGHKMIGGAIVWTALEPLRKTSMERALAIMNAIASTAARSHDLRGPATLEAMIVSKADQLSAAADLFRESLRKSGNDFAGVRHLHLREWPRHPSALSKVTAAPGTGQISARARRYPC